MKKETARPTPQDWRTRQMTQTENNLLGVLATLYKYWKYIVGLCLVVGIVASITVLLMPVYYKSTTVFYAASQDMALPEFIFGNSNQAMEYYGTNNDADRLITIAKSDELASFLIDSFNLYEHYEIDTSHRLADYYVKKKFRSLFEVKRTKEDAIQISIEDTDRELAAAMVNAARQRIDQIAQELIRRNQAKVLKTYESNLQQKQREILALSDSLERTRQQFGIYDTRNQAEMLATQVTKTEGKLMKNRAKLEALKAANRPALRDTILIVDATVRGLEKELETLQAKLNSFNEGLALTENLNTLYEELTQAFAEDQERYQQFKTAYESGFPTSLLVEAGKVPVIKERPKRTILVLASVTVAFVFAVLGVLVYEQYKNLNWKEIFHA